MISFHVTLTPSSTHPPPRNADPLVSHGLKEFVFEYISRSDDANLGVTEEHDPEDGVLIPLIKLSQVFLELPNKIALAGITSTSAFLGATALSCVVEIAVAGGAMFWHRGKAAAEDTIKDNASAILKM